MCQNLSVWGGGGEWADPPLENPTSISLGDSYIQFRKFQNVFYSTSIYNIIYYAGGPCTKAFQYLPRPYQGLSRPTKTLPRPFKALRTKSLGPETSTWGMRRGYETSWEWPEVFFSGSDICLPPKFFVFCPQNKLISDVTDVINLVCDVGDVIDIDMWVAGSSWL